MSERNSRPSARAAAEEPPKSADPTGSPPGVGARLPSNIARGPQIPSSPTVDRRREIRLMAQLVGSLFAHAEDLGDINDSKELPPRHSPQYP